MKKENKKAATAGNAEKQAPLLKAEGAPSTISGGKSADGGKFPSIRLSERDRQAGMALLALLALALVAYVLFLAPPADTPSDMDTFVGRVLGASNVSLLMDARGASQESARIVFQCGVDIAGGSLFGSKTVATYACDSSGCISANSAHNGSSTLTYDQVQKSIRGAPYILVRSGEPSTKFFLNHAEITLDSTFNSSCKLG